MSEIKGFIRFKLYSLNSEVDILNGQDITLFGK